MSSKRETRNAFLMMQDVYISHPHTPVNPKEDWTKDRHGVDEGIAKAKQQIEEFQRDEEIANDICRKASEEIHMLEASSSIQRLSEMEDKLKVTDERCATLTEQLRYMKYLYEGGHTSSHDLLAKRPKRRSKARKDSSTSTMSKPSTCNLSPTMADDTESIRSALRRELDLLSLSSVPVAPPRRFRNSGSLASMRSPRQDPASRSASEVGRKKVSNLRSPLSPMKKIFETYQSPRKTVLPQWSPRWLPAAQKSPILLPQAQKSPRKNVELQKSPRRNLELQKCPRRNLELQKSPRTSVEPQKSPRRNLELQKSPRRNVEVQKSPRKTTETKLSPRKKLEESVAKQSARTWIEEPKVVMSLKQTVIQSALPAEQIHNTDSVQKIHSLMNSISEHVTEISSMHGASKPTTREADIFGGAKRVSADSRLARRRRRLAPYELVGQPKPPPPSKCSLKKRARLEKVAPAKAKTLGVFTQTSSRPQLRNKQPSGGDQELVELYHNAALHTDEAQPAEEVDKKAETQKRMDEWKKLERERKEEEKRRRVELDKRFEEKKRIQEREKELQAENKRIEREKRVEEERKKRVERERKAQEERAKREELERRKAEQEVEVEEMQVMEITEKGYALPTVSSQLKRSRRERWQRFNFHCVPFVVGTSTSPSYNIGIVIQTTLSMMRQRGASTDRPVTALLRGDTARPITALLARVSRLRCPALGACELVEGWGAGVGERCTCLPVASRAFLLKQEMGGYTAPDLSQAHFFASLQSRVRGLKEVLVQLQSDFKTLNQRYAEHCESERQDSEAMKDLARQIQAKEDEIKVVLGLFKEVMSLKDQLKSLHGRESATDLTGQSLSPRRCPLVFPRTDTATVRLTRLMRSIQSFQTKLRS